MFQETKIAKKLELFPILLDFPFPYTLDNFLVPGVLSVRKKNIPCRWTSTRFVFIYDFLFVRGSDVCEAPG